MEGLKDGGIRKGASLWRGFDGGPSIVVDFLRAAVWRPGSVMRLLEVGVQVGSGLDAE